MHEALLLTTEANGALAIGAYPRFRYDGRGGGGPATARGPLAEGWQSLSFSPATLRIPPLDFRTTSVLGVPLPPGLQISILSERLQGRWHPRMGWVELMFHARFRPQVAGRAVAPDLIVASPLTTGSVRGRRHQAEGEPLDAEGRGVLVGVATVAPTGTAWLDRFLGLPDEALAVLRCRLRPS
jgi:hypothetical protein